jgi:ABC-2 type transport system permease protein
MRFLVALIATNLKASFALRGAFWLQVAFMALNNLIFFVMWWVFFDRFEEVRGWRLPDMLAIYGMIAGAFGIGVVFFAGSRELTRLIVEGDLDCFLGQPKDPLLQSVASKSQASGWGDIASAVLLLALSGYVTPVSALGALVGMVCGAIVFIATTVIIHSASFWLGNMDSLSRQVSEFMVLFSAYPKTVFSGALKVALYTIIPAGFIAYLPVELLRAPDPLVLAAVLASAVGYAALAAWIFRIGLRRYESGNRFGVRA